MKKFGLIYGLSFISFAAVFAVLLVGNPMTAVVELLLLIFGILSAVSFVYQLFYIIKLGRKENVSVGKGIAQFFMYFLMSISLGVLAYYIDAFFNGVSTYIFGGDVVYRMDAVKWLNDRFFYSPIVIAAIYAAGYFIVVVMSKRKNEK